MGFSYSVKLRRAARNGARIVCTEEPYEGEHVIYDPGYGFDLKSHPFPWVIPASGLRFNGRQVRIEGEQP